jgi:tetratricopeptide (TPR) repeat protein
VKKVMATVLGLLIVASGCSSKVYDEQVDSGKQAIEKGEYTDAVNSFEKAAKDKSTDEIQKYIRLANDMKDSATALKEEKYEAAIANAEKVTKEKTDDKIFKSAKEQADKTIKTAKSSQEQKESTKKAIQSGKDLLNQQKYDEAYQAFKTIADRKESPQLVSEATTLMNEAITAKKQHEDEQEKVRKEKAEKEQAAQEKKKAEQEQQKTKEETKKQQDTVADTGEITEHEAEDLVRRQFNFSSDVVVQYNNDDENGNFVIQVYEDHPDHTATLGWFAVNPKTKKVTKIQL